MANKTKKKRRLKKKLEKKQIASIAASILLISAVVLGYLFPPDAQRADNPLLSLDVDIAQGIDVSHHNGKIDWEKVGNEVEFAFVRVGYRGYNVGNVCLDREAKRNLKNANKCDVPIGVYFYTQAVNTDEAIEEAEFVLRVVKHYKISLPIIIDFEYAYSNNKPCGRLYEAELSKNERTDIINAFCDTIKEAGYDSGVYASTYIYEGHLNMRRLNPEVYIWVADYNREITYTGDYDIWQYSDSGSCDGVPSKCVDLDQWILRK